MVTFCKRDGKRIKITKKQFRNYFLQQKAIAEEKRKQKIIEESIQLEKED